MKKESEKAANVTAMGGVVALEPTLATLALAAPVGLADKRCLKLRPSRERSPRGSRMPAPTSSPAAGLHGSSGATCDDGRKFVVGVQVVLDGLSKIELNGQKGTIRGFDDGSSRWIVQLGGCDDPIKITIEAHPDNSLAPEDVPSSPWH